MKNIKNFPQFLLVVFDKIYATYFEDFRFQFSLKSMRHFLLNVSSWTTLSAKLISLLWLTTKSSLAVSITDSKQQKQFKHFKIIKQRRLKNIKAFLT